MTENAPTLEQIDAACRKVVAGWDAMDDRDRLGWRREAKQWADALRSPASRSSADIVEACAKLAEAKALEWYNGEASTTYGQGYQSACRQIADAIRASFPNVAQPAKEYDCEVCRDDPYECAKTPSRHCDGASRSSADVAQTPLLLDALREAERFMSYFSEETNHFVGPGTPQSCLAHIRYALATQPAASIEADALEGDLDAVVQLIHKHVGVRQRIDVDLTGVEDAARAILAARPPATPVETKTVYVKRWRTLVNLPAKYADEIVEALRAQVECSSADIDGYCSCGRHKADQCDTCRSFNEPQTAPNRMDKGRAFYLAMYEKDGAIWAANEHKELWCDKAEDYERRLSTLSRPHHSGDGK